ncbi:MAG: hypothetical protein FWD82_07010 [Defluviitaleaceae bacterium]|nr:hypothetical protein [Defluviitaleaceae bacterium]
MLIKNAAGVSKNQLSRLEQIRQLKPKSLSETTGNGKNFNFTIRVNIREIEGLSYYKNLKKHIFRQSLKYNGIDFFMIELRNNNKNYEKVKHIALDTHVLVDYTEEIEKEIVEELKQIYKKLVLKCNIYCASIVGGENDPEIYINPCLHLLSESFDYINDDFIINILEGEENA